MNKTKNATTREPVTQAPSTAPEAKQPAAKIEGGTTSTVPAVSTAPTIEPKPASQTQETAETAKAESKTPAPPSEDQPGPGNGADAALREYLTHGYYKGEGTGRYIDPALVDDRAKQIAEQLAAGGLKQSALNPILRELKRANKKTLPLEAKRGALAGAIPQAKQLVQRHRAPGLLVDILERNRDEVHESADYAAAVKHLAAVGVFLGDYQQ